MRNDMYHAVMNGGCGCSSDRYRYRRSKSNRSIEDSPKRESFGRIDNSGWDSHSHYSFSPLWKWIDKQVGQPWAKVRGEIFRAFRGKDVPFTLSDVLTWHVETAVVRGSDGKLYSTRFGRRNDLSVGQLYVCPKTQRLLKIRGPKTGPKPIVIPTEKLTELDEVWHAVKRDGVWWKIKLANVPDALDGRHYHRQMPGAAHRCVDAFLGSLGNVDYRDLQRMYGHRGVYCLEKFQLSRRDMKKHDLWRR